MDEEKILEDGFERYMVVVYGVGAATVKASSFVDVLAELGESGVNEEDVIQITRIDLLGGQE